MAEGDSNLWGIWEQIPMDVFVEVLLRLPTSSRRRFRLVCRLWRDTIDKRTIEMRSRTRTLVSTEDTIHLVDDLESGQWSGDDFDGMSLVGTCNGLICMWDGKKPDGPITLANPLTGERLAIPPLPLPLPPMNASADARHTYTFAYHPTTGRYKVLHVPYSFDRVWVFTLGGALWRDVATGSPRAPYDTAKGIVNIDGTVYWAVRGTQAKVMSFDLDTDHISTIRPLPKSLSTTSSWHLVQAGGRLGVAITHESRASDKIEVWVMEHATAGRRTWSRLYNIVMQKPLGRPMPHQHQLTLPSFTTHGSEYILTARYDHTPGLRHGFELYKHKPSNDVNKAWRGVVHISERNRGAEVTVIPSDFILPRTFAFVVTTEPLTVYRCW